MSFREKLVTGMPSHFTMPEEFLSLADWIEEQGYIRDDAGYIASPDIPETCSVKLYGSTRVEWPEGYLKDPSRLYAVASTGGDGSELCLWLDNDDVQHVVHHGSGSGSTLWATFPSALSALRLFAVGYADPAFNDNWQDAPSDPFAGERENGAADYTDIVDSALSPYRAWLLSRWGQKPPATGVEALELSAEEAELWISPDGPAYHDLFHRWLVS